MSFPHVIRPQRTTLALCLALAALSGSQADAATATGPLAITAAVTGTCSVGASVLGFSSASSATILAGNIDNTGTILVTCTSGSGYTVNLDAGLGTGATVAVRKMASGTNLLNYSIYTTAARTTVWCDDAPGSVTGTGTGAAQTLSAYGRIFSGQVAIAGSYTDTVNVTITY